MQTVNIFLKDNFKKFKEQIFSITSDDEFNRLSIELFNVQYRYNSIYHLFIDHLGIATNDLNHYSQIPFLPISFFKSHRIITGEAVVSTYFSSSGTSTTGLSKHYIVDGEVYEKSFLKGFRLFYGQPSDYCILALLPSYLEREGSSLVYMVKRLIAESRHPDSGFYLHNLDELAVKLSDNAKRKQKTLLIGVSFALLDFIENFSINFPQLMIMETGGMKGRRRELIRDELHEKLCKGFGVGAIHSEYGMTELFSQAYSSGNGIFSTPPWMKILIRDTHDPLSPATDGKTGGINVIDLANFHSCSFIATQDLGRRHPDGSFEVLGRFDDSDLRGCNLMIS